MYENHCIQCVFGFVLLQLENKSKHWKGKFALNETSLVLSSSSLNFSKIFFIKSEITKTYANSLNTFLFSDKSNYKQLLGAMDYSFLCAYAVGMYVR